MSIVIAAKSSVRSRLLLQKNTEAYFSFTLLGKSSTYQFSTCSALNADGVRLRPQHEPQSLLCQHRRVVRALGVAFGSSPSHAQELILIVSTNLIVSSLCLVFFCLVNARNKHNCSAHSTGSFCNE